MEYVWIALIVLAIAVLVFYRSTEKMTNKDLLATLDKFSKTGTKPTAPKATNEEAIYGPKAPKIQQPVPTPSSGSSSGNGSNVYPDIYGPEITPVPGEKKKKCKKGEHASDCTDDDTYEFNPDFRNAFPNDENEPQPFLTDFSKFQH